MPVERATLRLLAGQRNACPAATALLLSMPFDTPVIPPSRIILLLLSSREQARRGPRTRHPLRTTNDSEVERRDDALAFSSEEQSDPGECPLTPANRGWRVERPASAGPIAASRSPPPGG